MTHEQARKEARKRWGPEADAYHFPHAPIYPFRVGIVGSNKLSDGLPWGRGGSWESAFADAETFSPSAAKGDQNG